MITDTEPGLLSAEIIAQHFAAQFLLKEEKVASSTNDATFFNVNYAAMPEGCT